MAVFLDENVAAKIPKTDKFQVGISNVARRGRPITTSLQTPGAKESWLYYDVELSCRLDSGIVVHRRLPQVDNTADSLASCIITDPNIDAITGRGVNLISHDNFTDVVQRMAHSQYWFNLNGQAMRVGNQIPIPGIRSIGGKVAVPHDANPQWAYNKIVGNYSGVILWYAKWSLWYTLTSAPTAQQVPPQNLAMRIQGDAKTPDGILAPFTLPDDNAVATDPRVPELQNMIRG